MPPLFNRWLKRLLYLLLGLAIPVAYLAWELIPYFGGVGLQPLDTKLTEQLMSYAYIFLQDWHWLIFWSLIH